jgi:hypothetical protein
MSQLPISVKHGFGLILQLWKFNSFRYGLQPGITPVAAFYIVSVLLTNIYTCFHRNVVSERFSISLPAFSMYLALNVCKS